MNRCVYCGAQIGDDLDSTLIKLLKCVNCRLDIQMRGEWTGTGWAIARDLVKRFGIESVEEAEKRLTGAST